MNEVISSILDAEKKAEEIIRNAQTEAKALKISSDKTAEELKNDAMANFKSLRIKEIADAEKTAEEEYDKIIKRGEEKASTLIEQAKVNLVKVADKIVEGIIR